MTPSEIARIRASRQGVTAPLRSPADVVRRLLCVQAQDLKQASFALASRCGDDRGALGRALADGSVVRTWPMRGTLHLIATADVGWVQRLLAPRPNRGLAARRAALGLDDDTITLARRTFDAHLGRVGAATRDELQDALTAAGVSPEGQRGYHLLSTSAQDGQLVQTGLRDGEPLFALLEAVAPASPALPEDEAAARLAARYIDGHGPATEHDLAWWSGLPVTACRRALLAAGVARDGPWWVPADVTAPETGTRLIAGFDELYLGYRDRSAVIDPAHADAVCPGGNGVFRATVMRDGRLVATWRSTARSKGVRVDVDWFDGVEPSPLGEVWAGHAVYAGAPVFAA